MHQGTSGQKWAVTILVSYVLQRGTAVAETEELKGKPILISYDSTYAAEIAKGITKPKKNGKLAESVKEAAKEVGKHRRIEFRI